MGKLKEHLALSLYSRYYAYNFYHTICPILGNYYFVLWQYYSFSI